MKTMSSSSSFSVPHESSNYDQVYMHQTLLFSDSLKDLKNLRTQLYSAAKYFEDSYAEDTQKEIVVSTLKDYAIKAIVNTVDHLGSVTFKVNGLVDEQVDEVSTAKFRVSCIEQRLRTCQEYIDREGFTQQSLVMTTPKYHKRYILPDGETKPCSGQTISKYEGSSLDDDNNWKQMKSAIRATMKNPPQPSIRKGPSPAPRPSLPPRNFSFADKQRVSEKRTTSPTPRPLRPGVQFSFTDKQRESERRNASPTTSPTPRPLRPGVQFSFTDKQRESERRNASPTPQPSLRPGYLSFIDKPRVSEKRTTSPKHSQFPLLRSGSLLVRSPSVRSTTPLPDRTTAPISSDKKRYPSVPQKSYSMRLPADIDKPKDIEQQPSKSKSLLKALLSRRKSKKDETPLYTFLDEY